MPSSAIKFGFATFFIRRKHRAFRVLFLVQTIFHPIALVIGLDEFDFTRVVADIKAYIPLGTRNRILALRFRTSHSIDDDDDQVPFYLMETLGGAKTIRGYDEFRFRDERNLYVSAEYRWEVYPFVDFSLFFDAGKVFEEVDDFNFKQDAHRLWRGVENPYPRRYGVSDGSCAQCAKG